MFTFIHKEKEEAMTLTITSGADAPVDAMMKSATMGSEHAEGVIARDPTYYYCQRADEEKRWEKVDRFVFDNFEKAVGRDGAQRYNGGRVALTGDQAEMHGVFTRWDIEWIMRAMRLWSYGADNQGDLAPMPDCIRMVISGDLVIYDVVTGTPFRAI